MDPLKRTILLDKLVIEANKIIAKKHVKFDDYISVYNLYEYNCFIAHSNYYKKLTPQEDIILSIVLKKEYDRLEHYEFE